MPKESQPKLTHSDQTGFVKGRYISQNIRLLIDIMEYTNFENLPSIFLFVDFEKAYDSVEWNFILKVLELFNFGPVARKWFSVLYNDAESAVMNAAFLTNYFKVSSLVYSCGRNISMQNSSRSKLQRYQPPKSIGS